MNGMSQVNVAHALMIVRLEIKRHPLPDGRGWVTSFRTACSFSRSIHERLVRHPFELTWRGDIVPWENLDQKYAQHVLLRIDPEAGSGSAAPLVFAFRSNRGRFPGAEVHRERQPKTEALI